MNNGICRIGISGKGKLDSSRPYQVEALLEDLKVADELGLGRA